MNHGLRRRADQEIRGFNMVVATGLWVRNEEDEEEEAAQPGDRHVQRVVPIVHDRKNLALLRLPGGGYSDVTMTTLQHALAQGITLQFQLEDGEIQTEPTPSRNKRKCILLYEASEGGAGVLNQMLREGGLAKVARTALERMHYQDIDAAIAALNPGLLIPDPNAECVKGCYRCLLSYYNQPDHELIDRTDKDVHLLLLRMAKAELRTATPSHTVTDGPGSAWRMACANWNLPAPDLAADVNEDHASLVWRHMTVAAFPGSIDAAQAADFEARGFTVIQLPAIPPSAAPAELLELLGITAAVVGPEVKP